MKQLLLAPVLFSSLHLFADTPGKKQMHDSKVSFQNLDKFKNYTFNYIREYAGDTVFTLTENSIIIPPSGGAPDEIRIWGVHTDTKRHTDTISVNNYYAPDYVFIINNIENDSIAYTKLQLSNENVIITETNTDSITNKELITNAKKVKRNHYLKIGLFTGLGLAALGTLVWYFRKRKSNNREV